MITWFRTAMVAFSPHSAFVVSGSLFWFYKLFLEVYLSICVRVLYLIGISITRSDIRRLSSQAHGHLVRILLAEDISVLSLCTIRFIKDANL